MTNKRAKALTIQRFWNCKLCPACGSLPGINVQPRVLPEPFPVGFHRDEFIVQLKCCTLKGHRAVGLERAVGQWNKEVHMYKITR